MEVHHHAHTARKRFTHYIWEFLMLFLAVFCGFMAENFREHRVEAHREKQYATLLFVDVKADTAMLSSLIRDFEFVNPKVDSFQAMVNTQPLEAYPSGTWYYYGRFGTRIFTPVFQNAGLEQLKSSGALRLFRNQAAVRSITNYDQACRDMVANSDLQSYTYTEVIRARNKIFNAWYMNEIMQKDITEQAVEEYKQKQFPFLSEDKNDFIQYASFCQLRSYNNRSARMQTKQTLDKALELLRILKEEYHLK